jgi:hypothetical protein
MPSIFLPTGPQDGQTKSSRTRDKGPRQAGQQRVGINVQYILTSIPSNKAEPGASGPSGARPRRGLELSGLAMALAAFMIGAYYRRGGLPMCHLAPPAAP